MSNFYILTKYIPTIQADNIGEWIVDKENDGTLEDPIQIPFVDYSEMVKVVSTDASLLKNFMRLISRKSHQELLWERGYLI